MSEVKLVAITKPLVDGINTSEEFIAYCARVSNPTNQLNNETAAKLLAYCVRNKHWSIFEMVSLTIEIKTTRDIGRQILRHRSFSFQEFSQRYAEVGTPLEAMQGREPRLQDLKNRQNSIDGVDEKLSGVWYEKIVEVMDNSYAAYKWAIDNGIAKEQARVFLPEGLTKSRIYMAGTLRSWIHYCELRRGSGTQKEHREIAAKCWQIITDCYPALEGLCDAE